MDCCNVINLGHRWQRRISVAAELESHDVPYMFWPGVSGDNVKENIHKAHKKIVAHAKKFNYPRVTIGEDDLRFTSKGAWQYYLDRLPEDFDIYTASYYSGSHDKKFIVDKGFRGLTLYTVNERYYDTFLSLSEKIHLDTAIGLSAKIVTCWPFTCIQAPGYSDQRKKEVDDSKRLKGKLLYDGK